MSSESSYLSSECSREHPNYVNLVSCSARDRCKSYVSSSIASHKVRYLCPDLFYLFFALSVHTHKHEPYNSQPWSKLVRSLLCWDNYYSTAKVMFAILADVEELNQYAISGYAGD